MSIVLFSKKQHFKCSWNPLTGYEFKGIEIDNFKRTDYDNNSKRSRKKRF